MERFVSPQSKRKIKKEQAAGSSSEPPTKKVAVPKESDDINGPVSNKDYVCVAHETISVIAESIGISNIGDEIAASLAEDVSYKLQEIINSSCTIMRKSKRRKLLTSDVSSALNVSNVHHIFGHSQKQPSGFLRLSEGEIFIAEDHEVDLISVAKSSNVPKVRKPSYVTTSYPILQSIHTLPVNGHTMKTEQKALTSKPGVVNGDVKMEATISNSYNEATYPFSSKSFIKDSLLSPESGKKRVVSNGPHFKPALDSRSKLNGRVKFAPHGIRERLKRDTEEELRLSQTQLSFFNVIAKCIIEGPHSLFQQALLSLRHSRKVNSVSAPLLNFVALSVCHIPRHFGFLTRLLETIDVLLCNVNISPTHSLAVNRLVNALLAITADQNVLRGKNDFFLRRRAAQLLTRVLLVWGIEEQHVSELLSRVARVLGDSKEKIQSHYGALVVFQSLGKAALGWLSPLLKNFLPVLEKRYPHALGASNIQVEEIRGVLLDIVELLYCDAISYRFKVKASTIQEIQAMIHLDTLLYQYCGDAVCARRHPCPFEFQQLENKEGLSERVFPSVDLNTRHQASYQRDLRYISYCPQKLRQSYQNSEVFETLCASPIFRRKDIQFKFAGANPVPKDGLRKKVFDKTHVQFLSVSSNQSHSLFPQQHLLVGRMYQKGLKRPARPSSMSFNNSSLYNVL